MGVRSNDINYVTSHHRYVTLLLLEWSSCLMEWKRFVTISISGKVLYAGLVVLLVVVILTSNTPS